MPVEYRVEWHAFKPNEYVSLATMDDLDEEIKKALSPLDGLSAQLQVLEREINSLSKKFELCQTATNDMQKRISILKKEFATELIEGKWQDALRDIVKNATGSLDEKIRVANQISTKQISELVKHENAVKELTNLDKLKIFFDAKEKHAVENIQNIVKEICDTLEQNIYEKYQQQLRKNRQNELKRAILSIAALALSVIAIITAIILNFLM